MGAAFYISVPALKISPRWGLGGSNAAAFYQNAATLWLWVILLQEDIDFESKPIGIYFCKK
jgi:hypothetical protein